MRWPACGEAGPAPRLAYLFTVALMAALLMAGCAQNVVDPGDAEVRVCVSIPPQGFVVERIGGDRVTLEVLVAPGQSPAVYEPTPAQMVALDRADVYFRIGVPFEDALMPRIARTMPGLEVVDLREDITLRPLPDHHHGPGEDHHHDPDTEHGRMDPHIWMDPNLLMISARTVAETLARIDPDGAEAYKANLADLLDDLERLDAEIAEMLAPVQGRVMYVFHPAFGYFTDAYGLSQVAIETQGKEPGPRQLQRIISDARAEEVNTIFVQPEFSTAAAGAIAREIGAEMVVLNPLKRDYLNNMRDIARSVRSGLLGSEGEPDE